jgi:hypothetical protein
MNETLIGLLVTLAVIIGGNLLVVLVRKHHPEAADRLVRYLPLMAAAASSRDREAAIRRLVEEVIRLESEEAAKARAAAIVLATTPKPPTAEKTTTPPVIPGAVFALAILAIGGCTPQQRADARRTGVPVAEVVGGTCEQISGVLGADVRPYVEFACTVVRGVGSVLSNMSTDGGPAIDRPDGPPVKMIVRVYLDGGQEAVQP